MGKTYVNGALGERRTDLLARKWPWYMRHARLDWGWSVMKTAATQSVSPTGIATIVLAAIASMGGFLATVFTWGSWYGNLMASLKEQQRQNEIIISRIDEHDRRDRALEMLVQQLRTQLESGRDK